MNKFKYLSVIASSVLLFSACGHNHNHSSDNNTKKIKSKLVADSYSNDISEVVVYLDLNKDKIYDKGEPLYVTGLDGSYVFSVDKKSDLTKADVRRLYELDNVSGLKDDLKKSQDEVSAKQKEVDELKRLLDDLSNQGGERTKQIKDLEDKLTQKNNELAKLLEKLNEKINNIGEVVGGHDAILKNLQKKLDDAKKERKDLNDKIDTLKTDLTDVNKNISNLEAKLDKVNEDLKTASGEAKKELEKAKKALESELAQAKQERKDVSDKIDALNSDLKTTSDNVAEIKTKLEKVEDDLAKAKKDLSDKIDTLKTDLAGVNKNISDLEAKLDKVNKDLKTASDEAKEKLKEVKDTLETQLASAKQKRKELKDKLDAVEKALTDKTKEINDKIGELAKDTQAPVVVAISPENNEYNVNVENTKSVVVKFSEKVLEKSVKENLELQKDGVALADDKVEIQVQNNVVTITPKDGLEADKTYTLVLKTAIKDKAENELGERMEFVFTTGASVVTPPANNEVLTIEDYTLANEVEATATEFDFTADNLKQKVEPAGTDVTYALKNAKDSADKDVATIKVEPTGKVTFPADLPAGTYKVTITATAGSLSDDAVITFTKKEAAIDPCPTNKGDIAKDYKIDPAKPTELKYGDPQVNLGDYKDWDNIFDKIESVEINGVKFVKADLTNKYGSLRILGTKLDEAKTAMAKKDPAEVVVKFNDGSVLTNKDCNATPPNNGNTGNVEEDPDFEVNTEVTPTFDDPIKTTRESFSIAEDKFIKGKGKKYINSGWTKSDDKYVVEVVGESAKFFKWKGELLNSFGWDFVPVKDKFPAGDIKLTVRAKVIATGKYSPIITINLKISE